MPARGKRVASRQAQLNRRRRRQARGAADIAAPGGGDGDEAVSTAVISAPAKEAETSIATPVAADGDNSQASQARSRNSSAQEGGRSPSSNRIDQALPYRHLASELRRVLILAGVVTVALIAISFII